MFGRRYMHEYGATSEDFGRVAVADRKHAATNPKACFYEQPITLEDHQTAAWIVEPLHLLDCCQESDGGQALVVTSLERARDLQQPPAVIVGAAQGAGEDQEMMTRYYRDSITGLPEMGLVARQLYEHGRARSRRHPDRGHLRPLHAVRAAASSRSSASAAGARPRTSSGTATSSSAGACPINTHGGQLGEAYIHGMNGIAEGVRQVRGTSVNQVDDVEHVLVTAGTGVPTSGIILGPTRSRSITLRGRVLTVREGG